MYGTHIDYPLLHTTNNETYLNTDVYGAYALSGAIFLDSINSAHFTDFNSIIYGHHMEKETMFGEVGYFSDKDYFDTRRYGNLFFDNKHHGLEFFAFIHTDAYDASIYDAALTGEDRAQAYLANLFAKATHTRAVEISPADRIVLLSTCSGATTNGRDILAAKITDEVFENEFIKDERGSGAGADALRGLFAKVPPWCFGLFALGALAAFVVLLRHLAKKKARAAHVGAHPASTSPNGAVQPPNATTAPPSTTAPTTTNTRVTKRKR